ncbi:MAG: acyl carrier protein [Rhodobacteraceae bacterium]|nr:acyl carrier protein [Paracoccaceae bacterium]
MTTAQHDALKDYIQASLLGGQSVADDDELLLSGMIDSLGVMALVGFIEQTYGFSVAFEEVTLERFSTLGAIRSYVAERNVSADAAG